MRAMYFSIYRITNNGSNNLLSSVGQLKTVGTRISNVPKMLRFVEIWY